MSTATPPAPKPGFIDFYADGNYGKYIVSLGPGKYSGLDKPALIPDAQVSSLVVPAGLKATVFTGPDYTGASSIFTGPINVPNLTLFTIPTTNGQNWNDNLRSVIIESTTPGTPPSVTSTPAPMFDRAKQWVNANMMLAIMLLVLFIAVIYYVFFA